MVSYTNNWLTIQAQDGRLSGKQRFLTAGGGAQGSVRLLLRTSLRLHKETQGEIKDWTEKVGRTGRGAEGA